jgi:PAS domain S-box-containing protein
VGDPSRRDGYHDYYNQRWYEFTGMTQGSTDGESWNGMFHPDDQDRARATWQNCLKTGKPYEIECRLTAADGSYRWVLGRALPVRDDDGRIERWFGTCTDIHDQKRSAEKLELLSHELSHRIKKVFAVISGLIGVLARKEPAAAGFADELRQRVDALGRAHELVRLHTDDSRPRVGEATVQGLLHEVLSPYLDTGGSRLVVTGDDTAVDDRGATPLALIFHELATNAAKYGAWLNSEGRVGIDVTCRDGQCRLVWAETGGPPVDGPPEREGFGTGLARATVQHQLEGRVEKDWRREGLRVEITIPTVRLKGPDETP